jgi:hypothetical protein
MRGATLAGDPRSGLAGARRSCRPMMPKAWRGQMAMPPAFSLSTTVSARNGWNFSKNPAISAAIGQFAVIQATAPSLGVEVSALNIHRHSEIPGVIAGFARGTNDGLIVTASVFAVRGRDLIIADAAKRRLATATTDVTLLMPEGLFPMAPIGLINTGARPVTSIGLNRPGWELPR